MRAFIWFCGSETNVCSLLQKLNSIRAAYSHATHRKSLARPASKSIAQPLPRQHSRALIKRLECSACLGSRICGLARLLTRF